jgi:hypothetical protein
MRFLYGTTTYIPYQRDDLYRPYGHQVEYKKPVIQIVTEPRNPFRPFEDQARLVEQMFREDRDREAALDPLNFPGEKAKIQDRQIHFMLEHLAARHAISYQIRHNIDYQESSLSARLDEMRTCPFPMGMGSRQATELEKQLLELGKERWAEEVGCWRDTGRILTDIFDHWSEYSDHSRKARMMNIDL